MGCDVFANSREVSCKASGGKVVAAFPDVCLSPPSPPAGPIPLPYPLTSYASDTTEGTKTVKIKGQEVMRRDQSYFKQCTGDEAATRNFGMGVITHTITGKVYFVAWSMDVEVEGQNVDRHMDVTTSNHGSQPGNESVPWTELASMSPPPGVDCTQVLARFPVESYDEQTKNIKGGAHAGCQSHHVIQNAHFQYPRGTTLGAICPGYVEGDAPCIPLDDGTDTSTAHGRVSQMQKADATRYRENYKNNGKLPSYADSRADAKKQLIEPSPGPGLSSDEAECVLVEVDKYFNKVCKGGSNTLRPPGMKGAPRLSPGGGADGAL